MFLLLLGLSTGLAFAIQAADDFPLSLQLEVLERDLTSPEYRALLPTMISTDLAAEWQRVATVDNYLLFARQHGGLEKVNANPALRAAYARRAAIATQFLTLLRETYEQKKLSPPFADEALLTRVLESAVATSAAVDNAEVPVRSLLPCPDAERHWPCFRGPTAQGMVFDTNIPTRWSSSQNILWRVTLPGRGNSSPVVWGERLFVTAESQPRPVDAPLLAKDEAPDRLLLCYSLSGQLLWQHAAPRPAEHEVLYWKNTLASSTPVTDGQRVIVFFGNAGLLCCDLEGRRLWHADVGTFPTTHGPGAAPVLYQNLVVLMQDQNKGPSLCAAFDKHTGSKVWQHERPKSMGWSHPVAVRIGDHDELIMNSSNEIASYAPLTGELLWTHAGTSIESTPLIGVGEGLLFSVSGRNGPIFALRPSPQAGAEPKLVWRSERGGPHVPSPAYHAGRLYLVNDTGIVTCLAAKTGQTLWQKRLRGKFSSSPLVVGDRLLLTSEEGVTYVLRSGPQFELLGENDLKETVFATPAVVGGRLYFRTTTSLLCVGE